MTSEGLKRVGGATVIGLFGLGLLAANLLRLSTLAGPPVELLIAGLGSVVSLVLVAAAVLLARSEFDPAHALRIAGWATLGTVVLGAVLWLIVRSGVPLPTFAAARLLSVSTFAHVLIGVRDVQRIRAEDVARQGEKLAVLNRVTRHNLRHEAQQLVWVRTRLADGVESPEERDALAADIDDVTANLERVNDVLSRSQSLFRGDTGSAAPVDLAAAVEAVVAEARERHPDATITVDVPDGCAVVGGEHLRHAIAELVENALVHADGTPRVGVEATADGDAVTLRVVDDGPGIPEPDRSVIAREAEVTQLTHGQGLGLWFVRWVTDACGADFRLDSGDDGTTVTLRLPRAAT